MNKTPAVRFIGFAEDWEQRKLSDVVDSVDTGKSRFDKEGSFGEYPILGSTSVIGYDDEYDYEGNFILTARVGANAGSLYRYAGKVKISDNTVFIQASQNIEFIYQLLIQFDIKKLSFGTGQPLVKASELKSLELIIPTDMKEQMRIGVYFKNLDHLITLHQRKYEKLKNIKKSMLEKMFPKNGSNVPEIRFKGFTDAWEQRKLGELALFNPKDELPQTFEYVDLESVVGTEMLSHRTEIKSSAPSRAQRLACTGDIFYQTVRPYQKNNYLFEMSDNNYVFSTGYAQMRPFVDGYFLFSLIQSERFVKVVLDNCTGTSYPAINVNDLAKIEVAVPSGENEAHKIGTIFRSLDHLIALHHRKLEKLEQIKQAMLHKMFV